MARGLTWLNGGLWNDLDGDLNDAAFIASFIGQSNFNQ
jgi:hypothetical protein